MTLQSVRTDEIARSCRHFGRVLAATSQAIPSLYSAPVFGCAGLIKPAPGYGLAYIYLLVEQEFGIAAVLSGDAAMSAAYASATHT